MGACSLEVCGSGGRKDGWRPQWFVSDLPDAAHRSENKTQVWAPLVDVCYPGHMCDGSGGGCTECTINCDATVTVWGETLAVDVEGKLLEEDGVLLSWGEELLIFGCCGPRPMIVVQRVSMNV